VGTKRNGIGREGSQAKHRWVTAAGVILIAAGVYLGFAAAIMLVLALTDITGFASNVSSVALLLFLVGSGLGVGVFGVRLLSHRRGRQHPTR
jgi:hypothetical protein